MKESDTTVAGVFAALGGDRTLVTHGGLPRFDQQGWHHDGAAPDTAACPTCAAPLEMFGKPYETRGRLLRYLALACLRCGQISVLQDLGLSGRAGLFSGGSQSSGRTGSSGDLRVPVVGGQTATEGATDIQVPILASDSPLASSTYPLAQLPLPVRLQNRIKDLGVSTVGELSTVTRADVLAIRQLGLGSLTDLLKILDQVAELGLPVEQDSTESAPPAGPELDLVAIVQILDAVIEQLTPRDADVLRRRWCLDGTEPITLEELGHEYGVTRERIRQLQLRATSRINGRLRRHPFLAEIVAVVALAVDEAMNAPLTSAGWRDVAALMWPGCSTGDVGRFLHSLVHSRDPDLRARWSRLEDANRAHLKEFAARVRQEGANSRAQQSRQRRLDRLLEGAWWPPSRPGHRVEFSLRPIRDVYPGEDGSPLVWPSLKLGRDVQCESRMEAIFFELCDASSEVEWFTEQPVAIPYVFAGGHHRYFPDALVRLRDGRHVLVEVKPGPLMADAMNLAKWEAAWEWCFERSAGFLVCSDRYSANAIFAREIPPLLINLVLGALEERGSVDWLSYSKYRTITEATTLDLVALARRHQLEVHRRPWRLQRRQKPWGPGRETKAT